MMSAGREEYAPVAKGRSVISFILKPYINRVRLGEGGLVVFNLFHSIYAHHSPQLIVAEVIISFFVMCALYGFNDYYDRHNDIKNEKKDRRFIYSIIQNELLFIALNVLLTAATALCALVLLGYEKALIVLLVYAVNFLYSAKLKSIPLIDITTVAIWGALYVMISGEIQWMPALIVGTMTCMAHVFQIITDKVPDSESKISTTVVAMPGSEIFILSALCILLGACLFASLGSWAALTAVLPVSIYGITKRVTLSWYISRVYFFICWVALLTSYYASV
jgi:hypothetical protein